MNQWFWTNLLNEWFNDSLINTSLVSLLDESVVLNESLEWMIQWLTHKYFTCFITGWISGFERISWMNDSMTNTFFNSLLSTQILFQAPSTFLIATVDIGVYIHTFLSQYFCDNMNDCKTEITLCGWKKPLNFPEWLSLRFNRHRWIVVIYKIVWVFESRSQSFND